MNKRSWTKMIGVQVETIIEEPCLGRGFLGPEMTVWARGCDDGFVQFKFLHPKDHPKLERGVITEFEILPGQDPDVVHIWTCLGFSVEERHLLSFLQRVAVIFELPWEIEDDSSSSYPPPRTSSQPPALVN